MQKKCSPKAVFRTRDAVKQFGVKVAWSNTKANLSKMIRFMRAHPGYPKLMQQMKAMPGSRSSLVPASSSTIDAVAQARHFNKNYFGIYAAKEFRKTSSDAYLKLSDGTLIHSPEEVLGAF